MFEYNSYHYLPALRPEEAIRPESLHFFQRRKWWAQVKKNGTCSVIYVPPKKVGKPFAKTRHVDDQEHKAWQFTEKSIHFFESLQNDKWHVFSAELLHSKGEGVRDVNYVHDVVVYQGKHLIGSTFSHRHALLQSIFKCKPDPRHREPVPEMPSHWIVNDNLWVARCHQKNFKGVFDSLTSKLDEGLVLKDPCGILSLNGNSGWMVKCRRPHENYAC